MNESAEYLLAQLTEAREENRALRRKLRLANKRCDRIREEALAWQWGYLDLQRGLSTRSTALSPTGSAEES